MSEQEGVVEIFKQNWSLKMCSTNGSKSVKHQTFKMGIGSHGNISLTVDNQFGICFNKWLISAPHFLCWINAAKNDLYIFSSLWKCRFVFYSLVGNYQIERYQLLTCEQVAIMFDCKMFLYVHPLPKKPFFVLSCKSQIL